MKYFPIFLVSLLINIYLIDLKMSAQATSAVTYDFDGVGRFGDSLTGYVKAKALSYMYDIPVFYRPFPYTDQLVMHTEEKLLDEISLGKFSKIVRLGLGSHFEPCKLERNSNTLYVVSVHTNLKKLGINKLLTKDNPNVVLLPGGYEDGVFDLEEVRRMDYLPKDKYNADESWLEPLLGNEVFLQELRQMIAFRGDLETLVLPSDCVTIAAHVRMGGGFDLALLSDSDCNRPDVPFLWRSRLEYSDVGFPYKFPPMKFYTDQIKKIAEMFNHNKLYVYVFTDDQNPQRIVNQFEQELKHLPVTFAARQWGNKHDQNVLEDFFSMTKFDCLIRPASSFSVMVELIGKFKVVIRPGLFHWKGNKLITDDVEIIDNRSKFN